EARVALSVPKFRIDGATIALGDVLRQLGMTSAFTPSLADFGGMVADGSRSLALSDVYHQVFVRVDEKGTEAAAATAPVMVTTGAPMPPPDRVVVRFDRPFLFVLRATRTGAGLFLGRVGDPRVGGRGTVASAVPPAVMVTTGAPMPPPGRVVVRFDRPFLFVMRDTRTGAVLFLGRVGDPRAGR